MPTLKTNYFWKKLAGYYGSRLHDMYGESAPGDWRELLERQERSRIDEVLAKVRREHPVHPPSFPQVEKLFAKPLPTGAKRSDAELLTEYINASRSFTDEQKMAPWKWLCDADGGVSGVLIPNGSAAPIRVMAYDVLTSAA